MEKAILCVDDERIILDSLKMQLQDEFGDAFYYEIADNAEDALEAIEELQEDNMEVCVVISDWIMPGMKGDEFLIKLHHLNPNIIKIMLTGQADESAIERAKNEADLYACFYKPWAHQELINTIKEALTYE